MILKVYICVMVLLHIGFTCCEKRKRQAVDNRLAGAFAVEPEPEVFGCDVDEYMLSAKPPDPTSECCGRAVGVDKSLPRLHPQLSEYPWMGIVEYQKERKTRLVCSTILISSRYTLSAAQCFRPHLQEKIGKPANVRLGEYDTSNAGPDCVDVSGLQSCNDGALKIPIEKITTHPEYNTQSLQHDIALIRLAQIAPFTIFIKPICLPTSDITVRELKQLMWIAGWSVLNEASAGPSHTLKHVGVPFVDLDTCQSAYDISKTRKIELGNGQLCAGGESGKDACSGDSGGPLMYDKDDFTELAGIISFGPRFCGLTGMPSVYIKVFPYIPWIRVNIKKQSDFNEPNTQTLAVLE